MADASRFPPAFSVDPAVSRVHRHAWMDPALLRVSQRPPKVERVTVTRVSFLRGEGCCAEDPGREVVAYYDDDGGLIVEVDPVRDGER